MNNNEYKTHRSAEIPSVNSEKLLNGNRVLRIVHGDQEYQLRVTKENKLILTK